MPVVYDSISVPFFLSLLVKRKPTLLKKHGFIVSKVYFLVKHSLHRHSAFSSGCGTGRKTASEAASPMHQQALPLFPSSIAQYVPLPQEGQEWVVVRPFTSRRSVILTSPVDFTGPTTASLSTHTTNVNKLFLLQLNRKVNICHGSLNGLPLVQVIAVLQAVGHFKNVSGKVILGILLCSTHPITLQQVLFSFWIELNTPTVHCVTRHPQIVVKGVQAVYNQPRSEHRSFSIFLHDLFRREHLCERSLRVSLIPHCTQQGNACKPPPIVVNVLLYFIPVIDSDGITHVVSKIGVHAQLYVSAIFHPILLCKFYILKLLNSHQVFLEDTTFLAYYREAYHLVCASVRPHTRFHHLG